jgi:hypothetical protein
MRVQLGETRVMWENVYNCDNAQRDDCAAGADVAVSRKRADT